MYCSITFASAIAPKPDPTKPPRRCSKGQPRARRAATIEKKWKRRVVALSAGCTPAAKAYGERRGPLKKRWRKIKAEKKSGVK